MLCVKCGAENEESANCCSACGAILPRMMKEEAPKEEPKKINERLQLFEDAVAKVLSSEWGLEQFEAFLREMIEVLAEKERGIREIEIPPEAMEDFREELDVGFSGIELYNRGIAVMTSYITDTQPHYLEAGLELIRQGNERINEAMRINRENRTSLEEACSDRNVL